MNQCDLDFITGKLTDYLHTNGIDANIVSVYKANGDLTTTVLLRGQPISVIETRAYEREYRGSEWVKLVDCITDALDARQHHVELLNIVVSTLADNVVERQVEASAMPIQALPFTSIVLTSAMTTLVVFIACMMAWHNIEYLIK